MDGEDARPDAIATGADLIVDCLVEAGLTNLYCLPGIQNDALFNALFDRRKEITAIHTRHEQGAAYMALGASMATGRPSVYSVVPGPGVLNTTAALATAHSGGGRVLCLTGQIPSAAIGKGLGYLHELPDQLGILQRLTKFAAHAGSAEAVKTIWPSVMAALRGGRALPVALEIPMDVLAGPAKGVSVQPEFLGNETQAVNEDEVEKAAKLLRGAERPLIFVGGGAQDASAEITSLAEKLGAPVVAYRMGKGVVDGRNPLSQSLTAGHRLWKDCDVVLAIGTRIFVPLTQWGVDDRIKIIKVDVDETEMQKGRRPDIALTGDAAAVVGRINEYVRQSVSNRAARIAFSKRLKEDVSADIAHLEPQISCLNAIRQVLPNDGVLVDESTQVGYVARIAYWAHSPRTFLSSGYQGTLGWGFATALGAKHALGGRPVVSISGDGGFMFNVQELATAVHHKIPLVSIVFNDSSFGNVKRMQQELYGQRVIASDLSNPDFVKLAESFGVRGERATSQIELRRALERGLAADGPSLIEVPCTDMPEPWPYLQMPRIRG